MLTFGRSYQTFCAGGTAGKGRCGDSNQETVYKCACSKAAWYSTSIYEDASDAV